MARRAAIAEDGRGRGAHLAPHRGERHDPAGTGPCRCRRIASARSEAGKAGSIFSTITTAALSSTIRSCTRSFWGAGRWTIRSSCPPTVGSTIFSRPAELRRQSLEQDPDARTAPSSSAGPGGERRPGRDRAATRAELVPLRFQVKPGDATGRLNSCDRYRLLLMGPQRPAARVTFTPDRNVESVRSKLILGTTLRAARAGGLTPHDLGWAKCHAPAGSFTSGSTRPWRSTSRSAARRKVPAAVSRLGLRTAFISALPAEYASRAISHGARAFRPWRGPRRRRHTPGSRMGLYFLEYGVPPHDVRQGR